MSTTMTHVFAYADMLHPSICTLAASVKALGGSLNVVGLHDGQGYGAVPKEGAESIASSLAQHSQRVAVPGQRWSATFSCQTTAECSDYRSSLKIRKFFALRPHLKDFPDEDLIVFLDGFDAILETPSWHHLFEGFQKLQHKIGPLITPRRGPVIFSGEVNCWPFPHSWKGSANVSGDYRPDYIYNLGAGFRLRGDEICKHWSERFQAYASVRGPLHLPFPNSGVFIGHVSSLRHLFEFAEETLKLFGDFEDQALVYIMALRAAASQHPWVPLWVDVSGELLASLHGVDVEILARELKAPQVCDFRDRAGWGYFPAALGISPSRWDRRNKYPMPVVTHFNGDKKPLFATKCVDTMVHHTKVFSITSHDYCTFVDYAKNLLYYADPASEGRILCTPAGPPREPTALNLIQILGAASVARSVHAVFNVLVSLMRESQIVGELAGPASRAIAVSSSEAFCMQALQRHLMHASFNFVRQPLPSEEPFRPVNIVHVGRNGSSSACRSIHDYCAWSSLLRETWLCMHPSTSSSAGMMWSEIPDPRGFEHAWAQANLHRYTQVCTTGPRRHSSLLQESDGFKCYSYALAFADFLLNLIPADATFMFWRHRDRRGALLVFKSVHPED